MNITFLGKRHKFSNKAVYIFLTIVHVLFFASCSLISNQSTDSKLDSFSVKINDFTKRNYTNDFQSTIMSIEKNDVKYYELADTYKSMFKYFHYDWLVNGCRCTFNNSTTAYISDDKELDLKLVYQPTMSINASLGNGTTGYPMDYGQEQAFFYTETELANYLTPQNSCDAFIYISEEFASRLVSYYGIQKGELKENYLELIKNPLYNKIYINVDDTEKAFSVSINNILYSKIYQAPRIKELYGDFGVLALNHDVCKFLTRPVFEIDLKPSPYGNKNTFYNVDNYGFDYSNSDITFRSYNYETKQYEEREDLNEIYSSIWQNDVHNFLWVILFPYIMVLEMIFIAWTNKRILIKEEDRAILLWIDFAIFAILNIFSYFFVFNPLFFISELICCVFEAFFCVNHFRYVIRLVINSLFKKGGLRRGKSYRTKKINI